MYTFEIELFVSLCFLEKWLICIYEYGEDNPIKIAAA